MGCVRLGEPTREGVAHTTESTGDEVRTAGDDGRRAGRIEHRPLPSRRPTMVAATRCDAGAFTSRLGDDAGGEAFDLTLGRHPSFDMDHHHGDVRIALRRDYG